MIKVELNGIKDALCKSMSGTLKIVSLSIAFTAFVVLLMFGFAIWVFIPIFPAAIIYVIALMALRRKAAKRPEKREDTDYRKAA
jgi:hypothetical protein